MSKETFDPTIYNTSENRTFADVMDKELNRRSILRGGTGLAAMGFLSTLGLTGCGSSSSSETLPATPETPEGISLGFRSIAGSKTDSVKVPAGYKAQVLAPWGTPLNSAANPWMNDGSNTAEDQLNAVGMHHDGMHFFPLEGSNTEGLLCINHEYLDVRALHPADQVPEEDRDQSPRRIEFPNAEIARKEIYAHGVSIVHVKLTDGTWDVVTDSKYNRRITAATEMDVAGPIADTGYLKTKYTKLKGNENLARGTNNNCGNGHTPWGTYLTCEENWPGYFVNHGTLDAAQARLGITATPRYNYRWDKVTDPSTEDQANGFFKRFDITPATGITDPEEDFRNEANGHGYIVEIDPYDPDSRATKRTGLGRFRHEDCSFGKVEAGKPIVIYSGHDGRFEYLYKFVSKELWDATDASRANRLDVGSKYMDEGTLYVARFEENSVGIWLPLTAEASTTTAGQTLKDVIGNQAQIILSTPQAGDLVGATKMDRPEWTAVDPETGTVYLTLTNNTKRKTDTNAANPRLNNSFGHIIRWDEGDSPEEFTWDFFVFGSPASEGDSSINRSALNTDNEFASPDGLVFDTRGIMWVQTDNGADEVADVTNDQMLAIIPSKLEDSADGEPVVNATNQDALRRFFVGPNGAEVTGLAFTGDNKNFFLNIQHPDNWPVYTGNNAQESAPVGISVRPRSSTVVITRDNGEEIGV